MQFYRITTETDIHNRMLVWKGSDSIDHDQLYNISIRYDGGIKKFQSNRLYSVITTKRF